MTKLPLAIITVGYNSNFSLRSLAGSLEKQTVKPSLWIVVDNAPVSSPVFMPKPTFPNIIINGKEGDGFGQGCNNGLSYLDNQSWQGWTWLLNPDTILSSIFDLEKVLAKLQSLDFNTIMGTAVVDPLGHIEQSAGWIAKGLSYRSSQISESSIKNDAAKVLNVDWVSGCNICFKPLHFNPSLRFDPYFPLYFEDIDFCLRAKIQGGQCIWTNQLGIQHEKSTGSQCSPLRRARLKAISQVRFLHRYQPWWVCILHKLRTVFLAIQRLAHNPIQSIGTLLGICQELIRGR